MASGGRILQTRKRVSGADLVTERAPSYGRPEKGRQQGPAAVHTALICNPMARKTLQFRRYPWWGDIMLSCSAPKGASHPGLRALEHGHAIHSKESWVIWKRHLACSGALVGTEQLQMEVQWPHLQWEKPGPPSPKVHRPPPAVRASM